MDKYLLPSAIIFAAILYAWVNSTEIATIGEGDNPRVYKHNKITNTTYRVTAGKLHKMGKNGYK